MTTQKIDAAYLEREVTLFDPTKFWNLYPALKGRKLFPLNQKIRGKGFDKYEYKLYDHKGLSKLVNAKSKDIPKLNITAENFTGHVRVAKIGNEWTQEDVEAADFAASNGGAPNTLLSDTFEKCSQANDLLEDQILWLGDSENNLYGLTNHPNVSETVVANGASSSPLWSSKTTAEIVSDFADVISSVLVETKELFEANAVFLPLSAHATLHQMHSDYQAKTVMAVLRETYPQIKVWEFVGKLETAGTGGTRCMYALALDPRVITAVCPYENEFTKVYESLEGYKVAVRKGVGGVKVDFPLAIQGAYGF